MKSYCDLHIHHRVFQRSEDPKKIILLLEKFKYSNIAIVKEKQNLNALFEQIESIPSSINFYKRLNLTATRINDIKELLKKMRPYFDLIAVKSHEKSVFNWAIQDSRVDLLTLGGLKSNNSLSYESAKLLRQFNKPIEVTIRSLLLKSGSARSRVLRTLEKSINNIVRSRCPFIISSDAHDFYELRAPKDMISLLTLVDFPPTDINKGIIEHPLMCIKRVEARADRNVLSNDIEIVSR